MAEQLELQDHSSSLPPTPPSSADGLLPLQPTSGDDPPPPPPPRFDPSRMVGIIRRKALIKDLAAMYHAKCLAYCQELLEFQRKLEETWHVNLLQLGLNAGPTEPFTGLKAPEDPRKETPRHPKRLKKSR